MPPVKKELKTLKAEIRSLIVSSPVGLTVEKFLREFKECIGLTLPFKDFGYSNAQDFLNSMPDVLQVSKFYFNYPYHIGYIWILNNHYATYS